MLKDVLIKFLYEWVFYVLLVFSGMAGVLAFTQSKFMHLVALFGALILFFRVGQEEYIKRERWTIAAAFVLLFFGLSGVSPPH